MYAITYSLDHAALQMHPHASPEAVERLLEAHGLHRQASGLYFGSSSVTAVQCVLAVQAIGRELPWFRACVKDLRMLRVTDNDDLMPALAFQARSIS